MIWDFQSLIATPFVSKHGFTSPNFIFYTTIFSQFQSSKQNSLAGKRLNCMCRIFRLSVIKVSFSSLTVQGGQKLFWHKNSVTPQRKIEENHKNPLVPQRNFFLFVLTQFGPTCMRCLPARSIAYQRGLIVPRKKLRKRRSF
jgi:hypothetical protein